MALETPRFDILVVAGGIGGLIHSAADMLAPLAAFQCPIAYVSGNWDYELAYDANLGIGHHLHDHPLVVDGHAFIGFSGCETHWGANPIARLIREEEDAKWPRRVGRAHPPRSELRSATQEDAEAMAFLWEAVGIKAERTTVIIHARTHRLHELIPGLALHTFGHRRGF